MCKLFQIYEKFSILFNNFFSYKDKSSKEEIHTGSISFRLVENNESVDIKCLLPNPESLSVEEITDLAERYAELLVYINTEKFNSYIDKILERNKIKNDHYKNIMLIDNIKNFKDILYNIEVNKEYERYNAEQPIIRPSQAFSSK